MLKLYSVLKKGIVTHIYVPVYDNKKLKLELQNQLVKVVVIDEHEL